MPPDQKNTNNPTIISPTVVPVAEPQEMPAPATATPMPQGGPGAAGLPHAAHADEALSYSQEKIMHERHKGSLSLILIIIAILVLIIIAATVGITYIHRLLNVVHNYSN